LARKAIRNHTPNHLVRSISFLHRDYKPEYFYWEMVELGRRTILLGWVSFIDEGNAFTRIVVAMAVSLGAFVLTLTQKPYVHEEDQLIAVAGQFMLLTSFIGASYIKSFDEVKARSDAIASAAFGIDSADQIVVMIFSFTVAMILLLTGTLVALVSAEASMPLMRVKGTGKRPVLTLRTRQKWHLFNSHNWNSAQDAAATIKRQLQRLMPGVQVFLVIGRKARTSTSALAPILKPRACLISARRTWTTWKTSRTSGNTLQNRQRPSCFYRKATLCRETVCARCL